MDSADHSGKIRYSITAIPGCSQTASDCRAAGPPSDLGAPQRQGIRGCAECRHLVRLPGEALDERTPRALEPTKNACYSFCNEEFVTRPWATNGSTACFEQRAQAAAAGAHTSGSCSDCELRRRLRFGPGPPPSQCGESRTGACARCAVGFIREKLVLPGYLGETLHALI
jgi:hypothetical protein